MGTPALYHWLPVADDDVSVTLPPAQNEVGPLASIVGFGGFEFTVTEVAIDVAVQPFASVI
jgi:hypothetical protein